jgi:Ca2+-binding EF-hand superfamily protein
MRSYLLIAACCGFPSLVGASELRTFSIPVLTLSGSNQRDGVDDARPMVVEVNDRPAPESRGGIPPQYKPAGDLGAASQDAADSPTVRFLVPLVQRPVLVEATILIDDQPFGMRREERVRELLAGLEAVVDPVPSETTPIDPEFEGTVAGPSIDTSLASRLRRYSQATRRTPGHEEVRWFLAHWVGGPPLLMLDESFQAARAHQSPLFQILDRDGDGVISAEELAAAEQTLLRFDLNQDEILSYDEIVLAAKRTPSADQTVRFDSPPLLLLSALREPATMRRLAQYYDAGPDDARGLRRFDPDGRISETELVHLKADDPEIRIEVRFNTHDMSESRLSVTTPEAIEPGVTSLEHAGAITIEVAGTRLEISAVQSARGPVFDQISIGAVRDGYPLLPLVDQDEDGRLSVRELRELADRLVNLDRNRDGRIEQGELWPTLRVAIGHGPVIHGPLAAVRRVYPPPVPTATPPEWFVRMDRNRDGDLTPREFLGSQEQFDALDTDGDGLISVAEALGSREK